MKRTRQPSTTFSFDDIPKNYLSAPIADEYQPELLEMYRKRSSKPGFESLKMNPSTEKFYRLYFYQGVSQGDRAFLHQEFLETQSRKYTCTGLVLVAVGSTFLGLGTSVRYAPYVLPRFVTALVVGYATYWGYKMYSTHLLEKACDPFYEKYLIR